MDSDVKVVANGSRKRFEAEVDGLQSVLEYELIGKTIVFTHTGVPRQLEGRGIASALAKAGMEYATVQKLKVVPACSFIEAYIRRHPAYQILLAD